jgi:2-polyprenyl-3-methyl-5-hydroxy-6-metoxy-1,4-benzoquinol methylase
MELLTNCPVCSKTSFNSWLESEDYFLTGEKFTIVQCSSCGFRFTNPRPSTENLGSYYQSTDYISHTDQKKGLFAAIYQNVRKYTLFSKYKLISRYKKSGQILDIGCATGQFLKYMQNKNWSVTGIEPDERTREYARKTQKIEAFPEEKLNELPTSSFDVITLWHVLEHVSDLNTRMNQIKQLLKTDGVLVLALPNCDAFDAGFYGKYWAGYDLPRHLYHFTLSDVNKLAAAHGFRIDAVKPMKFDSFYVSLLSEKYKNEKMSWAKAIRTGWVSNMKASRSNNYSSLIYILRKNNP